MSHLKQAKNEMQKGLNDAPYDPSAIEKLAAMKPAEVMMLATIADELHRVADALDRISTK